MATVPHTSADEVDVLEAVVARIIASTNFTPQFSSATCYYSLDPNNDLPSNPGEMVCVVAPDSFSFDQASLAGGGENLCLQQSSITISLHSTMQLDKSNLSTIMLNHATRGLLAIKKGLLKANCLTNWIPTKTSGADQIRLTANPLMPIQGGYGRNPESRRKSGVIQISFAYDINLNLS